MKAQINKVNENAILVSLFNDKRIVEQKWFDTIRKANNYCLKYKYEVCKMNDNVDYSEIYNN